MSTVIVAFPAPPADGALPPPSSFGGLALSSSRGSVALAGSFEALEGTVGLGPPRRRATLEEALGLDGAIAYPRRPFRRDAREIDFIVHVNGETAFGRAAFMRQLLAVLSPVDGGLVTLTARDELGARVRTEGVAVLSGDGDYAARAAYDEVAVLQFTLACPDPLWRGDERSASQVEATSAPFFPILPLTISPSSSLGDPLVVDVGGDALTYPRHVITGPASAVQCANADTGDTWEVLLDTPLVGGEQLVVDTDPRTVFAGAARVQGPAGEDLTGELAQRELFALRPQRETVQYTVTGAGAGTRAQLLWEPRIEALL